ncbi:hypothetical protein BACCIP111895_04601 [Neobacillus rhizosphaerae]|uniref:Uncharacterized protein n=1 Tax=Neobacillus rhizosphaerae TaxID=2880965 RepID=A0ABM9EXJ4_9BACI|nr:hypothetical protein [Neobacillus rhizosphaerae]CAH2717409.1 hypothetical protein BACCIP111895_04601 [Neobacillus rhizosphaerae]
MMFKKMSLIASLLFFLLGTNVFAQSHIEDSSKKEGSVLPQTHPQISSSLVITASKNEAPPKGSATDQSDKGRNPSSSHTKKANTVNPSFKDYVVPVTVGLIIIVGFGSYWLIFRRKQV